MAADVSEMEIMIGELLELERLRDGRSISTTRQNLVSLVSEVARNYDERPPGVRVTASMPEILVDIDADRTRTVIRNLLENAIKYSSPTSRPVEISVSVTGETVEVRVTDDGVGIPEGDVERVFEPFFRVDRSRAKTTGGYGLGLSICKRVMEAHGGSIAVERRGVRGTSFVLTFPTPALARSA
jgi:signal transduction histidine kinase